jgi:hypothetical protein
MPFRLFAPSNQNQHHQQKPHQLHQQRQSKSRITYKCFVSSFVLLIFIAYSSLLTKLDFVSRNHVVDSTSLFSTSSSSGQDMNPRAIKRRRQQYHKHHHSHDQSNNSQNIARQEQPKNQSLSLSIPVISSYTFLRWNATFPCYEPENKWRSLKVQNTPTTHGFFYLKPYKTGSSSASGITLRIARNIARKQQQQQQQQRQRQQQGITTSSHEICRTRFDHGPDYVPGKTLYSNRDKQHSYLWTTIRHPTSRVLSLYYFFTVSRRKKQATETSFQYYINYNRKRFQDYYFGLLHPNGTFDRKHSDMQQYTNDIYQQYNFIGITERMDESAVVLMMLLNLSISDILYLNAKTQGGYDDASGGKGKCTYIQPTVMTSFIQDYFQSDEWQNRIMYDVAFYNAVNESLDNTINSLGRDEFQKNLQTFLHAKQIIKERCLPHAKFPCDDHGKYHPPSETDCIWNDSGCGTQCLDNVATELNLW